jgi:hypothetical protein
VYHHTWRWRHGAETSFTEWWFNQRPMKLYWKLLCLYTYICGTFYLRFQQMKPSTFCFIRRVRLLSTELDMSVWLRHFSHQTNYGRVHFQLHWVVRFSRYKTVHSVAPCKSGILKRTAYRMQKYAFKEEVSQKSSRTPVTRVRLLCSFCWLLPVCVCCWSNGSPFVLFLCFRSRSYPVPHRGERVKQRTVHTRN